MTIASSSTGETVVRNLNFNSTILVESLLFRYINYPLLRAQGVTFLQKLRIQSGSDEEREREMRRLQIGHGQAAKFSEIRDGSSS